MSGTAACRSLIVAMTRRGVIGRKGTMPWHQRADLRRFRRLTMGHAVIMGRRTFQAIGRLLPGRRTIVVSRDPSLRIDGAMVARNLEEAWRSAGVDPRPFIVGGAEIYALALPEIDEMFVTWIEAEVGGDTLFPLVDWSQWRSIDSRRGVADAENDFDYTFETFHRAGRSQPER